MNFKYLIFPVLLISSFLTKAQETHVLTNPVLSGFYPDPSICKTGTDYYLVNSTFAYFPGIPVFHSKDLSHWKQVGNVISRPSQMNFLGDGVSRGLFAPSISYDKGTYYVVCTLVDHKGNFVVTATNPAGPWSNPKWIPEVNGIDPSLFFEGDKAYIVYNSDAPDRKPLYEGHRTLRLYELNRKTLKVKGKEILLVNGGVDITKKPVWIEGPHLFKHEGYYYLIAAEGGTGMDHSEVVFRSKNVKGPFLPYDKNPILTQRDLSPGREHPVTSTGHADFVTGPDGKTYAVFLGTRPYKGDYYNTGRETFISPVKWLNGWPVITPEHTAIKDSYPVTFPAVPQKGALPMNGSFAYTIYFKKVLSSQLLFLRTNNESWYSLAEKKNQLTMKLLPATCMGTGNPAFIGKRQQHAIASATAEMDFKTLKENEKAGLLIFQNEYHFYYLCKSIDKGKTVIQLYKGNEAGKNMELITQSSLNGGKDKIELRIDINKDRCSFFYAEQQEDWKLLKRKLDGKYLSTKEAGGFVGSLFALYATSSGETTKNKAGFSWLKYSGQDDL
ncbi:glycoside hydrolase family 43 protein [Pedobacter sp. L105]|uniref:glycoside hydrolase family 43 protein n=1 Tax=Pedobacter sp. L105 TaxID=1641871 RepID=UPI00131B6A18|nr:glycoside hydrolase family 43 protein [Pedobacter sp. L105]